MVDSTNEFFLFAYKCKFLLPQLLLLLLLLNKVALAGMQSSDSSGPMLIHFVYTLINFHIFDIQLIT